MGVQMLINEFDLGLDKDFKFIDIDKNITYGFCDFLVDKPKDFSFYWLQNYDYVNEGRIHIVLLMKRHQKGRYKIMPNFEIVIK
jgi:hypothetical protein